MKWDLITSITSSSGKFVNNDFTSRLSAVAQIYIIQIMTKVYILSCVMPILAYKDKIRAKGPKHYPSILGIE